MTKPQAPQKIHPLADEALRALQRSDSGLTLPPKAIFRLSDRLNALRAKPAALREAVRAVVDLAYYLQTHQGPQAAQALLRAASAQAEALRTSGDTKTLEHLNQQARGFARFSGQGGAPRAPQMKAGRTRKLSPYMQLPKRF